MREGLEAEVCILSGGLGPTHDDRTVETLARVAGRELTVDEALAAEIEGRLPRRRGAARPALRRLRGRRPQAGGAARRGGGPRARRHRARRSPGADGGLAVALPGPPNELRRLWPRVLEADALRRLLARVDAPRHTVLRFFGPSESAVARILEAEGGEGEGLEVTVCAQDLEIRVDLLQRPGGEGRAARVEEALRAQLGDDLFAEDERPVAEHVLERCRSLGLTVATAESCTGGMVGARLTDAAGASDVYLGGVVAYSNSVKQGRLGVPGDVLERHGAVSAETAEAMAAGALANLGADAAVAVTGIAGPAGGTPEKPVGLVYVAAVAPGGSSTRRFVFSGDREAVRGRATAQCSAHPQAASVTARHTHA